MSPDVLGCVFSADSLFRAMDNGERTLVAHIELLAQEGEEIPEVSCEVAVDDGVDIASHFLAHVNLPGRTVRLNSTMDEGLASGLRPLLINALLPNGTQPASAKHRITGGAGLAVGLAVRLP